MTFEWCVLVALAAILYAGFNQGRRIDILVERADALERKGGE